MSCVLLPQHHCGTHSLFYVLFIKSKRLCSFVGSFHRSVRSFIHLTTLVLCSINIAHSIIYFTWLNLCFGMRHHSNGYLFARNWFDVFKLLFIDLKIPKELRYLFCVCVSLVSANKIYTFRSVIIILHEDGFTRALHFRLPQNQRDRFGSWQNIQIHSKLAGYWCCMLSLFCYCFHHSCAHTHAKMCLPEN